MSRYVFQFTGFVPKDMLPEATRATQTSVAVCLPTRKAFVEAMGKGGAGFLREYASVTDLRADTVPYNTGARLAAAKPGTWFYQDTWNHTPGENVWVEGHRL